MKNNLWQINFISWQIDGETMNRVRNFIFLDSKITADGDYNHEIKKKKKNKKKKQKNTCSLEENL